MGFEKKIVKTCYEQIDYNEKTNISRVSDIESDNSQNVGLEDYNNISDRIFPYFTTPSIKITLGQKELENSFKC